MSNLRSFCIHSAQAGVRPFLDSLLRTALIISLGLANPAEMLGQCAGNTAVATNPSFGDQLSSSFVIGGLPRQRHTATKLLDGRILVTGGVNSRNVGAQEVLQKSAQLFDPTSGGWTNVGHSALVDRHHYTATLLADGRVLIAGGVIGDDLSGQTEASCAVFDPKAPLDGAWQAVEFCLVDPRGWHTATRLEDGRVLIVGGAVAGIRGSLQSLELCSVDGVGSDMTCRKMVPMLSVGRSRHTATRLLDGRVWISGGIEAGVELPVDVFVPAIAGTAASVDTVTVGPRAGRSRSDHATVALRSGQLASFGGTEHPNDLELWHPSEPAPVIAQLPCRFEQPAATLLPDDSVLLFGSDADSEGARCIVRCPFVSGSSPMCERIGDLRDPRPELTATLLPGGRVLLSGAGQCTGTSGSIYFVNREVPPGSITTSMMAEDRADHTATLLPQGDLLVAGGSSSEIFRLQNGGGWTDSKALDAGYRTQHRATLLQGGKVLLTGGRDSAEQTTRTTDIYTPGTGWTAGPDMACPRKFHTATRLWDGRALVVGGEGTCPVSPTCSHAGQPASRTYEIYDPKMDDWGCPRLLPNNIGPRKNHSATLLVDGRVMLAGGKDRPQEVGFFDPLQEFTTAGPWTTWPQTLLKDRSGHRAILLGDGRVLLQGGSSDPNQDEGEILCFEDTCPDLSRSTQAPGTIRGHQELVLLPDGRVLSIGGETTASSPSRDNFVFEAITRQNPATGGRLGQWFGVVPSEQPHVSHTATLLPNQEVMIAGGRIGGVSSRSSERFNLDLEFEESSRPVLDELSTATATETGLLWLGQQLRIKGHGFRGLTEGSGGQGTRNSANDSPIVQLRSLNNEQIVNLPIASFRDEEALTEPVVDFPPGPSLVTLFVNGVPSIAQPLDIDYIAEIRKAAVASAPLGVASNQVPPLRHTYRFTNEGVVDATGLELELGIILDSAAIDCGFPISTATNLLLPPGSTGDPVLRPVSLSCIQDNGTIPASPMWTLRWQIDTFPVASVANLELTFDLGALSNLNASDLPSISSRVSELQAVQPLSIGPPATLTTEVIAESEAVQLRVSVTDFRGEVEPGQVIATLFTLENTGLAVAEDVILTTSLDDISVLKPNSCVPAANLCTAASNSGNSRCLQLQPETSCQWTLDLNVTQPPGSNIVRTIAVSRKAGGPDGWPGDRLEDNMASDFTLVQDNPDYPEETVSSGDIPAAAAAANEFLIVFRHDGSIKAQRLQADGSGVGQVFAIDPGSDPDITYETGHDKYWVVWKGDDGCLKLAKVYDLAHQGEVVEEVEVGCVRGEEPAIASGELLPDQPADSTATWVVYQESVGGSGGHTKIMLARPLGYQPPNPTFPRGTHDDIATDLAPRIAVRDNRLVALVWHRKDEGIYAQVFNPDAIDTRPPRAPFRLDKGMAEGSEPDIAYDRETDQFYAVWRKPSGKIEARVLTASPSPSLGNIFAVNKESPCHGCQRQPRIDCHNARCSVAWQRKKSTGGPGESIISQLFSTRGTLLGSELQIDTDPNADDQRQPAIVFAPDTDPALDRFLVAWAVGNNSDPEVRSRVVPLNALRLKAPVDGVAAPQRRTYEVTIDWTEATGQEIPEARRVAVQAVDNAGYFWFYDPENIEVVVSLRETEGKHWISYTSLTERAYEMVVRDCGFDGDCTSSEPMRIPSLPLPQCGGSGEFPMPTEQGRGPKTDILPPCDPSVRPARSLFDRFDVRVCGQDPRLIGSSLSPAMPLGSVLDSSWSDDGPGGADVGSAAFTFRPISEAQPEVAIKMVQTNDSGRYAVYYGGATDMAYRIEIIDRQACDVGSVCEPVLAFEHPAGDFCGGNELQFFP